MRRPVVIAYDVSEERTRRRLLRLLRGWRIEGQLSVHECLVSSREAEELYIQLRELIDEGDRLLLAWLDPARPVRRFGAVNPSTGESGLFHFIGRRAG